MTQQLLSNDGEKEEPVCVFGRISILTIRPGFLCAACCKKVKQMVKGGS